MTSLRTLALAATFLSAIALPALAQGSATPAPVAPAKGVTVHAPVHKAAGTAITGGTTGTAKPAETKAPATATAKPAAPAAAPAKPATPAPAAVTKTN